MNKNRIAQYCCAALVAAGVGLNIQNAIADYGIGEKSLSLVADPGSGSNSNSNSNSNSDSNSNSNSGGSNSNVWYLEEIICGTKTTHREVVVDAEVNADGWIIKAIVDGKWHYDVTETTNKYKGVCVSGTVSALSYSDCLPLRYECH